MALPTVVQHVSGGVVTASGNGFKYTVPNKIGAGNCLILGVTYANGQTPTVTDDNGNTWPASPTVSGDAGAGKMVTAGFVLPNANAGKTTIKVTFASSLVSTIQMTVTEVTNIATSSPVNGTASAVNQTGASTATGSFTPANNNANGGNFIWYYCFPSAGNSTVTSSGFTPGTSFTILDADIGWLAADGASGGAIHASQYFVQTTAAAINPSMATGDSTDAFNCIAIALGAASAGTPKPAGIHIDRISHFSTVNFPGTGTYKLQCPATGNLRLLMATLGHGTGTNPLQITSVQDSDGNNYTVNPTVVDSSFWYAANTTPNPNGTTITITTSGNTAGGGKISWRWVDISGAAQSPIGAAVDFAYTTGTAVATLTTNASTAASSAVLNFASVPASIIPGLFAVDTTVNNIANDQKVISTTSTTVTLDINVDGVIGSGDSIRFGCFINDAPILTPTGSNNLIIANLQTDGGPTVGFYPNAPTPTPASAFFDLIGYVFENDNDNADNADAVAHIYNTDTTAIHFNWIYGRDPGSHLGGGAIEFKAAPVASSVTLMGQGWM